MSSFDGERERRGTQGEICLPLVSPRSCWIRASAHGFIPWQLGSTPECPDPLLLKLPTSVSLADEGFPPVHRLRGSPQPVRSRALAGPRVVASSARSSLKPGALRLEPRDGKAVSWAAAPLSSWGWVCVLHPRALPSPLSSQSLVHRGGCKGNPSPLGGLWRSCWGLGD